MRRLISHRAVRLVVLMLMTFSALGFTVVLHYCTMSHSYDCCCAAEHQSKSSSKTSGTEVGNEVVSCDMQIVAGGLAPVALNGFSDASAKSLVLDVIALEPTDISTSVIPHLSLLAHADDIAPPTVDLYIRSGALLI